MLWAKTAFLYALSHSTNMACQLLPAAARWPALHHCAQRRHCHRQHQAPPIPPTAVHSAYGPMCCCMFLSSQWTCSTALPDSKYTKTASDTHLANQVLASTFCPTDLRRTKSPPRQRYDAEHYYAFTRGEVTTGWNHSTEVPSRFHQTKQLQQKDSKAMTATAKHRQHVKR
jgi:hypothetical protein